MFFNSNPYQGMGPIGTSYGMSDNAGHIQPLTTGTMTADRSTSALSRMFSGGASGGSSTAQGLVAGANTMNAGGSPMQGLGTAAGTGIGAYFGGPVGASIGGAIGGAVGGMFGGGSDTRQVTSTSYGDPRRSYSVLSGLLTKAQGV